MGVKDTLTLNSSDHSVLVAAMNLSESIPGNPTGDELVPYFEEKYECKVYLGTGGRTGAGKVEFTSYNAAVKFLLMWPE